MDKDLGQKEKLIQEEISDKGLDKGEFILELGKKKKGGSDLSQWTVSDLKTQITEYQNEKKKGGKDKKKPGEDIFSEIEQIKMTQSPIDEKETKGVEIVCKKLEKSQLNDKDIKVVIKNPKSVETGFLTSNYVHYEVETSPFKWLVRRRYSDFEWLRANLIKYHPGCFVPPLPSKKLGSRRFEDRFINRRMGFLQKFLDALLTNEDFKATEPLFAFLNISDRNQFEAKMKEISSIQPSPFIEDFKTLSGKVLISSDDDNNEKYFSNIGQYFKIQYKLYEKLNIDTKNFYQSFQNACHHLEEVQKDFEILNLLNSRVMMNDQITKNFEELAAFAKNWRRILIKQNETTKVHFKDFFKFMKMNSTSYAELIKHREELNLKFIDENAKLTAKKEKLWISLDVSKWEIVDEFNKINKEMLTKDKEYAMSQMCTKETRILSNMKKMLGYSNRMCLVELKKMVVTNSNKFMENIKTFSENFYPSLTDGLNIYSDLSIFIQTHSV